MRGRNGTKGHRKIWQQLLEPDARETLYMVLRRTAGTLSQLTNQVFHTDPAWVKRIPLSEVAIEAGHPETEMVGVYLRIEDGLNGHALLILPVESGLQLADSMLGRQPGSVTYLNSIEYSALAEVGNLAVSFFLNAVSEFVGDRSAFLRPSPPAVTVDMLGAILNTVVIPLAGIRDDLLVAGTTFKDMAGTTKIRFWVFPDQKNQDLVA